LILKGGWRYDLMEWFYDTLSFRGALRECRYQTVARAQLQPGEVALDAGCGTGTLALEVTRHIGPTGRVAGIDPGAEQIARAQAKAKRRHASIEFLVGTIEQLPFPDQTFDVAFSTLMIHHLPAPLKHQGLAEIARVLKAGGRLILADFIHQSERAGQAARFHAGGSHMHELVDLLKEAGFAQLTTEELQAPRLSAFPGIGLIRAVKSI
jgi:demethylmenaquinone methyltransferase/2-methoxy-6-polyprenyl-1,4-benzoquinol methylase/phosphoethanolamine N-methyltransferase